MDEQADQNPFQRDLPGRVRDIILAASVEVARYFQSRDFHLSMKGKNDPLTTADLAANHILQDGLMKLLPDAGWLSEETADDGSRLEKDLVWIVDPIDGTREFVNEVPEFSISVGLANRGRPVFGAIALPAEKRIIHTTFGGEVSSNLYRFGTVTDWPSLQKEPFEPGKKTDLKQAKILVSRSEWSRGIYESIAGTFDFEPTGSIARKLALVAVGEGDLVVSLYPKNDWDICGGIALIEKTPGYRVVDLETGEKRRFDAPGVTSYGLVAGRAELVEQFVEFLKEKKIEPQRTYE